MPRARLEIIGNEIIAIEPKSAKYAKNPCAGLKTRTPERRERNNVVKNIGGRATAKQIMELDEKFLNEYNEEEAIRNFKETPNDMLGL